MFSAWPNLPKVILNHSSVPPLWLTDYHISKSNVRFVTWNSPSNAYHKANLESREFGTHLSSDYRSGTRANPTGWQTDDDDIVPIDTP